MSIARRLLTLIVLAHFLYKGGVNNIPLVHHYIGGTRGRGKLMEKCMKIQGGPAYAKAPAVKQGGNGYF